MMKKCLMLIAAVTLAGAARAEQGFLRAVFKGSEYDGTSVVSLENGATVVSEPVELYTNSCPENTTYAFVTYMLMEPGETYYFKGSYDDYVTLKIDEEWVLKRGAGCEIVNGFFQVPSGLVAWHKLELRVSNGSGAGGATGSVASGQCYGVLMKNGNDWMRISPYCGIDFHTVAYGGTARYVSWRNYSFIDHVFSGSLSFSLSDGENDLLFSSSADGTNWNESAVCTLGVNDNEYSFSRSIESGKPFVRFGARCGSLENWSATLDLSKASAPVLGEVSHDIVLGEDDVTFTIPILALGAGATKAKVYVRYGLVGSDDFKKTQVATVTSVGTITPVLEDLEAEKEYAYTVVVQNTNGGIVESAQHTFVIQRKWQYGISNGEVSVTGVSPSTGTIYVPSEIEGYPVTKMGGWGMRFLEATAVVIPEGVRVVEDDNVFSFCPNLTEITLPSTLVEMYGGCNYYTPCNRLNFYGAYPSGEFPIAVSSGYYSREYGASWLDVIDISTFKGYWQTNLQNVVIVSTAMRKDDPTVMEVNYRVESEKPTVKVRVLAFEGGERSFAKVVRPVTFIDGTEASIGDSVAANVDHRISWRVSADWKIDVAKVQFEVLAVEDDILPLELTTLPRIGEQPSIEYSWNVMEESRVLDALFWLYADGREGLTVTDGVLKNGSTKLADGTKLNGYDTIAYVYSGMGYRILAGEELEHVKNISRLKLSPSGFRQYAVKTLE